MALKPLKPALIFFTIASLSKLYSLGAELFIASYSGAKYEFDTLPNPIFQSIIFGIMLLPNLGWFRAVRKRPSIILGLALLSSACYL